MGTKRLVSFTVPIGTGEDQQKYLATGDGVRLTDLPDEAIRFRFRTSSTPLEEYQIEQRLHELAGGLAQFIELSSGLQGAFTALRTRLENELWPDGKPEAETPEAIGELEAQLQDAWDRDRSPLKEAVLRMEDMSERLGFMAAWPILIEDPPPGWERIENKEGLDPNVFGWIRKAYNDAVQAYLEGKS